MKKISTKMLAIILPVIIISMVALTLISAQSSKAIIEEQIANRMNAEISAQMNSISEQLKVIEQSAIDTAKNIGLTYSDIDLSTYESLLGETAKGNPMVSGSGIWFEPYVYDAKTEYVGPYAYMDGDKVSITYDYANAEYDYPNQEYYKNVANGETGVVFTEPYYDKTMDIVMCTCSMPIYNAANDFIGVVTVDMDLTSIQEMVKAIQIGENGKATLTTDKGVYMSCEDASKTENQMFITDDENTSLATAGSTILANENGMTTYQEDSESYNVYYDTLPKVGWKLMIEMPQSELEAPVNQLMMKLALASLIAVICSIIAVMVEVTAISRSLRKVQIFAGLLASGDFTIDALQAKTKDELGQMGKSLNEMYANNKEVIQNISEQSDNIRISSDKLSTSSNELLDQFAQIEDYMSKVNEAMMSSSAATEEVNASVEEVSASVNVLSGETVDSKKLADQIRSRATKIEETSQVAFTNATNLSREFEINLGKCIENAKVVESIGTLASVISNIAEQINLLSLNASIEAARAGEQGKGFAVVASEIGKLAGETSKAVDQIQTTIQEVQKAFDQLTGESSSLLKFLTGTVTPDYDKFVNVAKQYGVDAVAIEDFSQKISIMSEDIDRIMNEVSLAVQNIAESAQNTAENSSKTLESVNQVSKVVDDVSIMSGEQQDIAGELSNVVGKFKL